MIGFSAWLGRGQSDQDDYYVGGRNLPWWAVGISTMATQASAISFISIPAFVALKEGGGLTWLQYELAVPLAMLAVMILLIPHFRKLELVSVYEYLEMRFSLGTRLMLSGVFLLSRGLATGIGVYASAIVLSVALGMPIWGTILLIGVVTVIYDMLGGMAAVVWSDVIQMGILLAGLAICVYFAADMAGGLDGMLAAFPAERAVAFDPAHGLGDGAKTPFWGFLIGGLFLYVSYYGVDQSQAQRELSAPTLADTKRSLIFNGLARFPMTVMYIVLGIAVGAVFTGVPELREAVQADFARTESWDYLVPRFVLMYLPTGVRALLFAAILAAAMSSLDSAINSLSAATMRDFVERLGGDFDNKSMLKWSRITTVLWGAAVIGFAFLAGNISDTVVEGINKVGSAFYGPILAVFLAGVVWRRANAAGVISGCLVGVGFNLVMWLVVGEVLYWMWWNLFGTLVALAVAAVVSLVTAPPSSPRLDETVIVWSGFWDRERAWLPIYGALVAYFGLILAVVLFSGKIVGALAG
jgi:SSS family transporter